MNEEWRPLYRSVRRVKVGDLYVRYIDAGDGPCVFLLHGIAYSAFGWRRNLLPLVRGGFRVLAIDTPGFGYSDAPPEGTFQRQAELPQMIADHLDRVLDTFDIRSCSVVGHSLGGTYASLLTIEHPHRVERLVLAAPAIGPHVGLGLRLLSLAGARLIFRSNARLIRWAFSELVHNLVSVDDEEIAEVVRTFSSPQVRRVFADMLKASLGPRGIRQEFLLLPRLSEVRVPTLLMWGRHDRIIPIRNADPVMDHLPQARLEVFERSGHMLFLEEVDHFNSAVLAFLEDTGARPP